MTFANDTDDDILRGLLTRSTDGLTLEPGLGHGIAIRLRRRQLRRRFCSVAVTGAAASVVVVSLSPGGTAPKSPAATASPAIELTASQRVLFGLADTAADAQAAQGRYAVMSEIQAYTGEDSIERTVVLDGETGDNVTYQRGAGLPAELRAAHVTPTAAEYAALPRDPSALAAVLIKQANADLAAAQKSLPPEKAGPSPQPIADHRTDADKVFEQAAMMLWNPLVQPSLRASLYRVLADTDGVQVDANARDSRGREAVLLRHTSTSSDGYTISVYQDQATAQTLQTTYLFGAPASASSDIYLSVKRSNAIPTNPYGD
jgi:hypothetical protein